MDNIQEIKLIHRTAGGTLVRSAATLQYKDGRIWFLRSPFALKSEIKAMAGAKWHGYDVENPRQIWSVTDCQRNRLQLAYLMGEDVYAWFDREIIQHDYARLLMPHQKELTDHFLTYHYGIMAAEMGCVAGEAMIEARIGAQCFVLPLAELYGRWRTDHQKRFSVIGIKGYHVRLLRVIKMVANGWQPVVKVTLESGRTIRVTADHELCVDANRYKRADALMIGECVLAGTGHLVDADPVVSVVPDGETAVYDIRCEHPHHNFRANGIVVANCGKTLSVQEVMERSGIKEWWWIGPKTSLPNIRREFRRWSLDPTLHVEMMNYEALVRIMDEWEPGTPVPQGVVADESSRLKGATSQRTDAMQRLADMVRDKYGFEGYVIEMSGTPSPKSPLDWWSQCEIAWPGFLKEGSPKALEDRLAFLVNHQYDAGVFKKRVGWKDDQRKCKHCGQFEEEGPHSLEGDIDPADYHVFEPSFNEVAYLHERLKGLVIIKHKKDCLDLPEKRYRRILCKPSASTLRVAQALVQSAPNTITGLTWLRELSDGFQYREVADGMTRCPHCHDAKGVVEEWFEPSDKQRTFQAVDMLDRQLVARLRKREVPCPRCGGKGEVPKMVRVTKEVACPKDKALRELLDECEETGRIVIFAGFTGSIDRIVKLCLREKWDVVRCDQGEFQVLAAKTDGSGGRLQTREEPLDYWSNLEEHSRVAFVAHPESGGMSLTLTEARMAVYWSNSFKPEYRTQSEDRIHRLGMDLNKGCVIVDLLHLPTDQKVLDVIRENRRLELMSMGEIVGNIDWSGATSECESVVEVMA